MKCVLAAMGFINEDIRHNKNVSLDTMKRYSGQVDIVIFGEAFLQGFYGATFAPAHDRKIAVCRDDAVIQEIGLAAKEYEIAVSFGVIEREDDLFYSSQITIDAAGQTIDVYRRVSPGWKESFADGRYREGKAFHTFPFQGRKVAVGLCGDLWYDGNIDEINRLTPDVVFWPVYTDYSAGEWNTSIKQEYAAQAGKLHCEVLYVNSLCKDKLTEPLAKGGAALFRNGAIEKEIPSGKEDTLLVEV